MVVAKWLMFKHSHVLQQKRTRLQPLGQFNPAELLYMGSESSTFIDKPPSYSSCLLASPRLYGAIVVVYAFAEQAKDRWFYSSECA